MTSLRKNLEIALTVAAIAVTISNVGCKVTSQDVDYWKGTAKGPGKIVAVLLAPKYEDALRVHAAVALIEMDRQDVDGSNELQQALQKLDDPVRKRIIAGMAPLIEQLLKSSGEGQKTDSNTGVPADQIRAKDAAFQLIPMCDPQTRETLIKDVINWYVDDFENRSLSGNYSVEQVVRALGAPAAAILVDALTAKLPQQALVKLAELIGQLGNAGAKTKAAQKIVRIETEMESEAFLSWLEGEIRKQMERDKKKFDAAQLTKMCELNRQKFIVEGALPAMKHLADQGEVSDRLLQIALTAGDDRQTDRRVAALQALEGNATKAHLSQLLTLALDVKNPVSVRDYAFDRIGDIRSPEAIPPMWPLVQDTKDQRLRWRAGELVLSLGGAGVLVQFLDKLPSADNVEYPPEELEGYASRMSQMTPLPTALAMAQLSSPKWSRRVIGIDYLIRRGAKSDIGELQKLVGDVAPVKGKGWDKDDTVGSVAKRAISALQSGLAGDANAKMENGSK